MAHYSKVVDGMKYCRVCGDTKPTAEFQCSGKKVDALCFVCRRLERNAHYRATSTRSPKPEGYNAAGEKWCAGCRSYHNVVAFAKGKQRYDGLRPYCKAFENNAAKEMRKNAPEVAKTKDKQLRQTYNRRIRAQQRKYDRVASKELKDIYLRRILGINKGVFEDILPVYRELIKLKRLLRHEKHART